MKTRELPAILCSPSLILGEWSWHKTDALIDQDWEPVPELPIGNYIWEFRADGTMICLGYRIEFEGEDMMLYIRIEAEEGEEGEFLRMVFRKVGSKKPLEK